jgi:hypothetical protein
MPLYSVCLSPSSLSFPPLSLSLLSLSPSSLSLSPATLLAAVLLSLPCALCARCVCVQRRHGVLARTRTCKHRNTLAHDLWVPSRWVDWQIQREEAGQGVCADYMLVHDGVLFDKVMCHAMLWQTDALLPSHLEMRCSGACVLGTPHSRPTLLPGEKATVHVEGARTRNTRTRCTLHACMQVGDFDANAIYGAKNVSACCSACNDALARKVSIECVLCRMCPL